MGDLHNMGRATPQFKWVIAFHLHLTGCRKSLWQMPDKAQNGEKAEFTWE
jgi:hypothetical protein